MKHKNINDGDKVCVIDSRYEYCNCPKGAYGIVDHTYVYIDGSDFVAVVDFSPYFKETGIWHQTHTLRHIEFTSLEKTLTGEKVCDFLVWK